MTSALILAWLLLAGARLYDRSNKISQALAPACRTLSAPSSLPIKAILLEHEYITRTDKQDGSRMVLHGRVYSGSTDLQRDDIVADHVPVT